MRLTTLPLALSLVAAPLAAQRPGALAAGLGELVVPRAVEQAIRSAELKPRYVIRMVSDWPQLSDGGGGCINGGQEVLEGTLSQTSDGDYAGRLRRTATIRFCGVHGAALDACALTLTSEGEVEARGMVEAAGPDWGEPRVELRWHSPDGSADALVEGDCAPAFNQSLRRLYLGAFHAVEFPLPTADEGPRVLRLEDYGWVVEVR